MVIGGGAFKVPGYSNAEISWPIEQNISFRAGVRVIEVASEGAYFSALVPWLKSRQSDMTLNQSGTMVKDRKLYWPY